MALPNEASIDLAIQMILNYMPATMVILALGGAFLRWGIFVVVRHQKHFVEEFNAYTNHYLNHESNLENSNYKENVEEIFRHAHKNAAQNAGFLTRLSERVFLFRSHLSNFRPQLLKWVACIKGHPTHDEFLTACDSARDATPGLNRVLGFLPIRAMNRLVNALPGLLLISGILVTLLGFAQLLPNLENFSQSIEGTEELKGLLKQFSWHLGPAVLGVGIFVVLSTLNLLLSSTLEFLEIPEKMGSTLHFIWSSTHAGNAIPVASTSEVSPHSETPAVASVPLEVVSPAVVPEEEAAAEEEKTNSITPVPQDALPEAPETNEPPATESAEHQEEQSTVLHFPEAPAQAEETSLPPVEVEETSQPVEAKNEEISDEASNSSLPEAPAALQQMDELLNSENATAENTNEESKDESPNAFPSPETEAPASFLPPKEEANSDASAQEESLSPMESALPPVTEEPVAATESEPPAETPEQGTTAADIVSQDNADPMAKLLEDLENRRLSENSNSEGEEKKEEEEIGQFPQVEESDIVGAPITEAAVSEPPTEATNEENPSEEQPKVETQAEAEAEAQPEIAALPPIPSEDETPSPVAEEEPTPLEETKTDIATPMMLDANSMPGMPSAEVTPTPPAEEPSNTTSDADSNKEEEEQTPIAIDPTPTIPDQKKSEVSRLWAPSPRSTPTVDDLPSPPAPLWEAKSEQLTNAHKEEFAVAPAVEKEEENVSPENAKRLETLREKLRELEGHIQRAYEDKVAGKINDSLWSEMHRQWAIEKEKVQKEINSLNGTSKAA